MNTQYILFKPLLLLTFGLISCSPDKSVPAKSEIPTIQVEVARKDKSYQKISETRTLEVSSSIKLGLDSELVTKSSAKAEAQCKSDALDGIATKVTNFSKVESLNIVDLIPVDTFTPSRGGGDPKVYCLLTIDIKIDGELSGEVRLINLEVTGIGDFFNLKADFLKESREERRFYSSTHIGKENLVLPINQAEIQTLCLDAKKLSFPSAPTVNMAELFDSSLFNQDYLQRCRLVVVATGGGPTWVSRDFLIQPSSPMYSGDISDSFAASPRMDLSNKTLSTVTYTNTSPAPVYYKAIDQPAFIVARAVYIASPNNDAIVDDELDLQGEWRVRNAQLFKKEEGENIYILHPGASFSFELVSRAKVNCPFPTIDISNPQNNCRGHVFTGFTYDIIRQPSFWSNRYLSDKTYEWKLTSMEGKKRDNPNQLPYWAPYSGLASLCQGARKVVPELTQTLRLAGGRAAQVRCTVE